MLMRERGDLSLHHLSLKFHIDSFFKFRLRVVSTDLIAKIKTPEHRNHLPSQPSAPLDLLLDHPLPQSLADLPSSSTAAPLTGLSKTPCQGPGIAPRTF